MKPAFYIIDDDLGIRHILANIIEEYRLGYIIGESEDGIGAVEEIIKIKPDIVLVDLLLPNIDGVDIVNKVKERGFETQFIMISQVTSKDIIGQAYESGIEYYINKPINVIEVVALIKKVTENINLKQALSLISKSFNKKKDNLFSKNKEDGNNMVKQETLKIFSELGILGETGSKDLLNAVEIIINEREKLGVKIHKYRISDIYRFLKEKNMDESEKNVSIKAIEQRIRRIIQSALQNLASVGMEDYTNLKFEKYSTSLFDFKEVKREMDYLRDKSNYRGKISVKKFIEGIINHIENE